MEFNGFDSLEDIFAFASVKTATPADDLCAAVEEKNYPAAYAALRRIGEPLAGMQAEKCLCAALNGTVKLFRGALDRCAPGEHAGHMELPHPEDEDLTIHVSGTFLTLAAALDKPKHAALLLERGWDVNSGAPASAQAIQDAQHLIFGRTDSNITCETLTQQLLGFEAETRWSVAYATPLAATIVMGSVNTAKVLLAHRGVKKLESPAVCRAAILALHGTRAQRACLRLALGLRSDADDSAGMARELLIGLVPDVAVIADLCTPDELALRLDGAPCARERLRAASEVLCPPKHEMNEMYRTPADGGDEKLCLLLDCCPELAAEQELRDRMLNAILARMLTDRPCETLLERWKAACGDRRDVSRIIGDLILAMMSLKADKLRDIFARLGEGGLLCASAESAWFSDRGEKRFLAVWLDCVSFYRETGFGASVLAQGLLRLGDARLLRASAERGALRGESREELIAFLGRSKGASALRAMVLTLPDDQIGIASARPQTEETELRSRWERMDAGQQCGYLRQMWEEPLNAEECKKRMHLSEGAGSYAWMTLPWDGLDGIRIDDLTVAACCGRNPELLRVLLENGRDPRKQTELDWTTTDENLKGTMLCMAAVAGRTEQVRILLDRGLDPNEDDVPERSVYRENQIFGNPQVVTPLYMALMKGQLETAALLRERGGYAYPAM